MIEVKKSIFLFFWFAPLLSTPMIIDIQHYPLSKYQAILHKVKKLWMRVYKEDNNLISAEKLNVEAAVVQLINLQTAIKKILLSVNEENRQHLLFTLNKCVQAIDALDKKRGLKIPDYF